MFYTYILKEKSTGSPFYVGKGKGQRMYVHRREALNENTNYRSIHRKIQSILGRGDEIEYCVVDSGLTEDQAFELEIFLIAEIGREDLGLGPLKNLTEGGEGGSLISAESVELRRQKHIGSKRSPEARERMRQAQLDIVAKRVAETGVKRSAESRAKQSAATTGKKWAAPRDRDLSSFQVMVRVYNKATREFIGEFDTINSAAVFVAPTTAKSTKSIIARIYRGDLSKAPDGTMRPSKSTKGYVFMFKPHNSPWIDKTGF